MIRAAFDIKFDGISIPNSIKSRVVSVEVTDETGLSSDTLRIELDDKDRLIELPGSFVKAQISAGYDDQLIELGVFALDEFSIDHRRLFTLSGKGFDTSGSLKTKRDRSFSERTLETVCQRVARENDLAAAVDSEVAGLRFEKSLIQKDESDLQFLSRLAKTFDCTMKVVENTILISRKATGKSVGGLSLDGVEIRERDLAAWRFRFTSRDRYKACVARVTSSEDGGYRVVREGKGSPTYKFQGVFSNETEALEACKAKLSEGRFKGAKLSVRMAGNPFVRAQTPVRVLGFRDQIDGQWYVESVTHKLSNNEYTTNASLVQSRE